MVPMVIFITINGDPFCNTKHHASPLVIHYIHDFDHHWLSKLWTNVQQQHQWITNGAYSIVDITLVLFQHRRKRKSGANGSICETLPIK